MAEFLIRLTDAGASTRDCWKRGDIINVAPDGFAWGRKESKAVWIADGNDPAGWHDSTFLLKVPGLTLAKARNYVGPEVDLGLRIQRSLWRIKAEDVPQWVKTAIAQDAEVTVTPAQIKAYIENKVTRETADL